MPEEDELPSIGTNETRHPKPQPWGSGKKQWGSPVLMKRDGATPRELFLAAAVASPGSLKPHAVVICHRN